MSWYLWVVLGSIIVPAISYMERIKAPSWFDGMYIIPIAALGTIAYWNGFYKTTNFLFAWILVLGLSAIMTMIISRFMLGEPITISKCVGVVLVAIGCFLTR